MSWFVSNQGLLNLRIWAEFILWLLLPYFKNVDFWAHSLLIKSENLANLPGLKVKNGFNLDTNVDAQNLHLPLDGVCWLQGSGTVMVELSSLGCIDVIDITQKFIDRWIDQINRVVKVKEK